MVIHRLPSNPDQPAASAPPSPQPISPLPARTRKKLRRNVVLTLALLLLVAAAGAFYLLRTERPAISQYKNHLASLPTEQIHAHARSVENKLAALAASFNTPAVTIHSATREKNPEPDQPPTLLLANQSLDINTAPKIKPPPKPDILPAVMPAALDADPVRQLHFSIDEVNAWIVKNIEDFALAHGHHLPQHVKTPVVMILDNKLTLAFNYQSPSFSQSFSASFDVSFLPSGNALLKLDNVNAGSLPTHSKSLHELIKKHAPSTAQAEKASRWLDKLHHLEFKPVYKFDDGQKIRVLDYKLRPDGIDLTVMQEKESDQPLGKRLIATVPTP